MTETSRGYASALFDLAVDSHIEDLTQKALHEVKTVLCGTPDALATLASPAIPMKERLAMLEQVWGETLPGDVMGFLQVLCRNGHIRELGDCVTAFDDLLDTARKLSTATVVSAVELTDAEKDTLQKRLEQRLGRTIRLECSVDPSLLGGLIVEVDGRVMDGSLKHRLHEIKEVMNG
ncbi:MAG: ATP synthase F1 subunit delta [Christensenellaceae bacterium]|nr:ATP synthase F1 subunit delta [Christensenellaceae bacterium]